MNIGINHSWDFIISMVHSLTSGIDNVLESLCVVSNIVGLKEYC